MHTKIFNWGVPILTFFLRSFVVAALFLPGLAMAEKPVSIDVIAPSFAPLQMDVEGEVKGYVVDLVRRIITDVSKVHPISAKPFRILPWRRAMSMAEKNPNTLMFSFSRTPARESKFQWVGEVSPYEIYFYKLARNKQIKVASVEDFKSSEFRLGIQVGSNTQEYLEGLGFIKGDHFVTYSHFNAGIKMLFRNRFQPCRWPRSLPVRKYVNRGLMQTWLNRLFAWISSQNHFGWSLANARIARWLRPFERRWENSKLRRSMRKSVMFI